MTIYKNFEKEADNWIYNPCIFCIKIRKTQIFFKVQTTFSTLYLVKNQLEFHKENQICVTNKVANLLHMKKVSYLIEVRMKILSAKQHQEYLIVIIDIEDRVIKVRKEHIY